jgi:PEP-CTERM motif
MLWLSKNLTKGLAAAMFFLAPLGAYANLLFSYAGSPFVIFSLGSAYSPANHVTFSFEVADPLPANLFRSDGGVNLLNWSYTDGLQTASRTDPLWSIGYAFETDATGTMIGWIFGASSSTGNFQLKHWSGGSSLDNGYEFAEITGSGSGRTDIGCGVPRCAPVPTWTITETAAVPEPGTFALFAAGLALLVHLSRRHPGNFRRSEVGA